MLPRLAGMPQGEEGGHGGIDYRAHGALCLGLGTGWTPVPPGPGCTLRAWPGERQAEGMEMLAVGGR